MNIPDQTQITNDLLPIFTSEPLIPVKLPSPLSSCICFNLLTPLQCNQLIECSLNSYKSLYTAHPQAQTHSTRSSEALRELERVIIEDENSAVFVSQVLEEVVPAALNGGLFVGISDRWRFLKYSVGNKYSVHVDGEFQRDKTEKSLASILFYLNNVEEGGKTIFYDEKINKPIAEVTPQEGKVLVYIQDGLLHEGEMIRKGEKYAIRNDLIYK